MRKCVFEKEECVFHGIFQVSQVLAPSLLQGGHNGGVVAEPMAVVETKDGRLCTVRLQSVRVINDWSKEGSKEE